MVEYSGDLRGATFRRVDLTGARFVGADLTGARFTGCELGGVVMRGIDISGADIDAPWLLEGNGSLLVNGIDVAPYVDAQLDAAFPGRELRRAEDPAGLAAAWAALEGTWETTIARAGGMAPGTVDVSVDGEWSLAQTVRHLVMAIDTWLGRAILLDEQAYHPIGQPDASYALGGHDPSVFRSDIPPFDEVLEVWRDRARMVREFIAGVTPDVLAEDRANPWAPQYPETVLSCLRTIIEEGWEHHRFAVRDLNAIEAGAVGEKPATAD